MTDKLITSRDNQLVKRARAVRDGRSRTEIFIEGVRLCEEASAARLSVSDVLFTEKIARELRGARVLDALREAGARLASLSESIFASVSDTETPQGIVALARRPDAGRSSLSDTAREATPLLVIMHRVGNPANAGAVLRTAEAAGATGAILTEGTTDIFSPKALRGAMGSSFRLPLWAGAPFQEVMDWCKERGIVTVCADLRARHAHTALDWTRPSALIVGAEAAGLTPAEMEAADEALRIPMRPPVESLNVAVAASIVLYEAARQRAESSVQ